jgi:PKD repeat protein
MKRGNFTLSFIGVDDYSSTFLWDSNGIPLPLTSKQPYTTKSFLVSVFGAVSAPIARFTFIPENPRANDTVTFDASQSYDPGGGSIQSYEWAFGDNTTSTKVSSFVNHIYSQNGVYLVNLTIVGAANLTGSTTLQVQVGSIPTANFTYSPIGAILPADIVTFNATESAAINSTIVTYSWDFGDNSTITINNTIATHSYSVRGVYTVNLAVIDNDGLSNATAVAIQVGKPPSPLFNWNPASPMAGDSVAFTASATADTGVSIANYTWDFGEQIGAEATNDSVILHAFPTDGNWTVTLTVFDSDALHSSYSQNVEVTAGEVEQKPPDYTLYIVVPVVVILVAVGLVVRKIRAKKEEALDI